MIARFMFFYKPGVTLPSLETGGDAAQRVAGDEVLAAALGRGRRRVEAGASGRLGSADRCVVFLRGRWRGQGGQNVTDGEESLGTSSPAAAGPRQNPALTRTESGDSGPRDLLGVKVKQLRGSGGARRR